MKIIESAKRTLRLEAEALLQMQSYINNDFETIVKEIRSCTGRIVITGIGKSAIIAQKIVATMNSTGTPAMFMHAADAVHGDLGMVQAADIVICISKSGNTPEIKILTPLLKSRGNRLIGMVGNIESYLALHADYVLNTSVSEEACPNNLTPSTSTTAQLAMGDALSICLLEERQFTSKDFAYYHPGGVLGKQLYLRVEDIARKDDLPQVKADDPIRKVIMEISSKRLGATAVITDEKHIIGIITDGDLRRMIEKKDAFFDLQAQDIMNAHPKTIDTLAMAVNALDILKQYHISQLLVTKNELYSGVIHLHDLTREGFI